MPVEYIVEIYEPGSADDALARFASDKPFMALNAGDILNPWAWPAGGTLSGKVLRILNVEHRIYGKERQVRHQISVFTEEAGDTREVRLARLRGVSG